MPMKTQKGGIQAAADMFSIKHSLACYPNAMPEEARAAAVAILKAAGDLVDMWNDGIECAIECLSIGAAVESSHKQTILDAIEELRKLKLRVS